MPFTMMLHKITGRCGMLLLVVMVMVTHSS